MTRLIITGFVLTSLLLSGCSKEKAETQQTTETALKIYTGIAPLNFVCKQLLGEQDQVLEICPVGEDEPEYIPVRSTLVDMINSDAIIINGASFENWLNAVSIPETKIHDSAAIYKDEWVEYQGVVHSHGGQDDHSHTGYNGHTWLSPHYFKKQCTSVYKKLKLLLSPEEQQKRDLEGKYNQLMDQLSSVDKRCAEVFESVKGTSLAATHPTYDYIGKAYGFEVLNLDIPPDVEKIDETIQQQLDLLKQQVKEKGVTFLFWEEEPNELISKEIAKLGVRNLVFHPLAGMDDPDYITGMLDNLNRAEAVILDAKK